MMVHLVFLLHFNHKYCCRGTEGPKLEFCASTYVLMGEDNEWNHWGIL
jgi:hypothetical protein